MPIKMHDDEIEIDLAMVHQLLEAQFPQWAALPLVRITSSGTVNAIFRLGDELAVRMPLIDWGEQDVLKEAAWLPYLASRLPLPISEPLAIGSPTEEYPLTWGIYRWLPGEIATLDVIDDHHQLARDLAQFITALHQIDTQGETATGLLANYRADPLVLRDDITRSCIAQCAGIFDTQLLTSIWEEMLLLPPCTGPGVWLHTDIQSGNLLAQAGRLSAVIDFGGLTIGDPALDLLVAWNLLTAGSRAIFRAAMHLDDLAWSRGRAWAFSIALVAFPYYLTTNPILAASSRHVIEQVLAGS